MEERVQKVLSQLGIASRRQSEQLIGQGRVQVNGLIAYLGQKIDPTTDELRVDGRLIRLDDRPDRLYLLVNKPTGYVSTCVDPWQRATVLELLPPTIREGKGLYPVGRLDADSTGALLITNDGPLTFQLTHPRHHISKTYHVWIQGVPSDVMLDGWRTGVLLDDRLTQPAHIRILRRDGLRKTQLEIILREGRNRQIRRVAEQLGHPVLQLHRTAIGSIQLDHPNHPPLPSGAYRALSDLEIRALKFPVTPPLPHHRKACLVAEECPNE